MAKLINKVRERKFRLGTNAFVLILLAIVIFIPLNLLAGLIGTTYDLTREQVFTLTPTSRNFLAGLEQDVTITSFAQTGMERPVLSALLAEYAAASRHITVQTRDPMINPGLVHQYALRLGREDGLPSWFVIVESGDNVRAVLPWEMLTQQLVNFFTGEMRTTSYNFESEITRAIYHVTQVTPKRVYFVTGSGEAPPEQSFIDFLEAEGFLMEEIDLTTYDVPYDADILFIPLSARDWTGLKAERILNFLQSDGRAYVEFGLHLMPMPNRRAVFERYGVIPGGFWLVEGDPNFTVTHRRTYNRPIPILHEITLVVVERGLTNYLSGFSTVIIPLPEQRIHTEIEPLWFSSPDSFGRADMGIETRAMTDEDFPGPFLTAVAITDREFILDREHETKLVVVASDLQNSWYNFYVGFGNWQFIVQSLNWLSEQPPAIFVPSRRPPGEAPLTLTDAQQNMLGGFAVGILPLSVLGVGVVVWMRRRHS